MPQHGLFTRARLAMFKPVIGCLILLSAPAAATAAPITFVVTGMVTEIENADLALALGPNPALSATYSFDSELVDLYAGSAASLHGWFGPASSLTITIGNFTGTFDGGSSCRPVAPPGACSLIEVYNDPDDEEYQVLFRNVSGPSFAGFEPFSFEMVLLGNAGSTSFSSDALPVAPPYVPGFDDFNLWSFNFAGGDIYGEVSSITAADTAVVPEPTTFMLFGIGAVGAALRRRWRR
jgi:hypothetical protein